MSAEKKLVASCSFGKDSLAAIITAEEHDAQIIKLETERDLYRQLYNERLGTVTKGAKA